MLHTINKSPFERNSLADCIRLIDNNDVVLLLEDGVYAAMANTKQSHLIENLVKEHSVYAISADLSARGIDKMIDGVKTADYDLFVDLVEEHKVQAW